MRIDNHIKCRQLNQHLLWIKTLASTELTVVIDSKRYSIWGLLPSLRDRWVIVHNSSLTLCLPCSLLSLPIPGVLTARGGADGERDPDVGAFPTAPADPGRGVHSGRPAGEHLETGEPLPEPQRLVAEAGGFHQGETENRDQELIHSRV